MSIYDLIEIRIGREKVQARPINWDKVPSGDESDETISVSEYMTTCPLCAQLLKFTPIDIININGDMVVNCTCVKMETVETNSEPQVEQINNVEISQSEIQAILNRESDVQFIDPIANKYVDTSNYML